MIEQKPDQDFYALEDARGEVVEEVNFKSSYFLMRTRISSLSSVPDRKCIGRFNGCVAGQWIKMRNSYTERMIAESMHLISVERIMEYLESQKWSL